MEAGNKSGPNIMKVHLLAAMISLSLGLAILGFWAISGASMVTQYQVAVTEIEEDEFGDEIETTVMKDQFQFGLLPDKGYDGAAPLSGGLFLIGIAVFFIGRRKEKKQ